MDKSYKFDVMRLNVTERKRLLEVCRVAFSGGTPDPAEMVALCSRVIVSWPHAGKPRDLMAWESLTPDQASAIPFELYMHLIARGLGLAK